MDELAILRAFAACTTTAATMVAANLNARFTVAGFAIFVLASVAWMADGWFESKSSLVIQNATLLIINILACGAGFLERRERQETPSAALRAEWDHATRRVARGIEGIRPYMSYSHLEGTDQQAATATELADEAFELRRCRRICKSKSARRGWVPATT